MSSAKWKGDSGMLGDPGGLDVEITSDSCFRSTQFGTQLVLVVNATDMRGNVTMGHEIRLKCGSKFVVADGGTRALHESGDADKGFHPKSAVQGFIEAALKSGAPLMDKSDDPAHISTWIGSKYHLDIATGEITNDDTGEVERTWFYYTPTRYLGEAGGSVASSNGNGSAVTAGGDVAAAEKDAVSMGNFYTWYDRQRDAGFDPKDPRIQESGPESIWARTKANA